MDFNYLESVRLANENVDRHLKVISQKEILHYEILSIMHKRGLLDSLTFAGGTALRLCYDSERLSEDLDFNASSQYEPQLLLGFGDEIKQRFTDELGVDINVKEPKRLKLESEAGRNNFDHVNVDRWQITFEMEPDRRHIPRQKIKLEVAQVPSYTQEKRSVKSNYPEIFDDPNIILPVENLNEIMADKLVSLPASQKYIRYRDMWDLSFLSGRGETPNIDFIERKINDYKIENFEQKLLDRINSLPKLIQGGKLADDLTKYLPEENIELTLRGEKNEQAILETLNDLLVETHRGLYKRNKTVPIADNALLDQQAKDRIAQVHLISGGNHPRTVFRDIAQQAIKENNGDKNNVDWQKVEQQTIDKSILEKNYNPNEVVNTIAKYSPACLTNENKKKVIEKVNNVVSKAKNKSQTKGRQLGNIRDEGKTR